MPRPPYFVIADDFTGAAELAALAHHAGMRAVVVTEPPTRPLRAEVLVFDSNSRLDTPAVAKKKVRALASRLRKLPHAGLFKKTDSVLRGNVVAEIEGCMAALGLERALLVPCNPSLGRMIHGGLYYVGSKPLHQTAFARDPHHPRRTARVTQLIPGTEGCFHTADQMPDYGIVVGEATNPADVSLWASRLDASMLPAGGADFFRMWLAHQRAGRRVTLRPAPVARATLLLSGTATPADPITPLPGALIAIPPANLPPVAELAQEIKSHLADARSVSVVLASRVKGRSAAPGAINRMFSELARRLRRDRTFDHAILTGGTTAASVLTALDWHRLEVVHVWGPGVVTLRPVEAPRFLVTVKPGSYAWPAGLRNHFALDPTA